MRETCVITGSRGLEHVHVLVWLFHNLSLPPLITGESADSEENLTMCEAVEMTASMVLLQNTRNSSNVCVCVCLLPSAASTPVCLPVKLASYWIKPSVPSGWLVSLGEGLM